MPKFNTSEEARLYERDRYLDSLGTEIPIDYNLFLLGNERENDCVLCGNLHNNVPLPKLNPLKETYKLLDIHTCQECLTGVKQMMLVTYPHLLEEYMHEIYKENTEYDDHEKNFRLQQYNLLGKFPDDTRNRYEHLTLEDVYAIEYLNKCPFCNTSVLKGLSVDIAVNNNTTELNGGKVTVCRSCEFDMSLHESLDSTHHYDTCTKCFASYHVAKDEAIIRKDTGTWSKHMCPKCTHDYLEIIDTKDLYYEAKSPLEIGNRFISKECSSCEQSFVIDRTITPEINERNHLLNGKIFCSECVRLRTFKSNDNKVWVKYCDDVYIVVYKEGKFWKYKIFKVQVLRKDAKRKPIKLYESEEEEKDCVIATFKAFRKCSNLIESKQIKLWENP